MSICGWGNHNLEEIQVLNYENLGFYWHQGEAKNRSVGRVPGSGE
jgi:hypothetical protein